MVEKIYTGIVFKAADVLRTPQIKALDDIEAICSKALTDVFLKEKKEK